MADYYYLRQRTNAGNEGEDQRERSNHQPNDSKSQTSGVALFGSSSDFAIVEFIVEISIAASAAASDSLFADILSIIILVFVIESATHSVTPYGKQIACEFGIVILCERTELFGRNVLSTRVQDRQG